MKQENLFFLFSMTYKSEGRGLQMSCQTLQGRVPRVSGKSSNNIKGNTRLDHALHPDGSLSVADLKHCRQQAEGLGSASTPFPSFSVPVKPESGDA